jgi:hypothetical protein
MSLGADAACRHARLWTCSAAAIVAVFAAYALAQPQAPRTATVKGCVTETLGQRIPGADVRAVAVWGKRTAVTDASGCYAFTDLPAGRVDITAELLGFASQTRSVLAKAGKTVRLDFKKLRSNIGSWPQPTLSATDLAVPCPPPSRSLYFPIRLDPDEQYSEHRKRWYGEDLKAAKEEPLCNGAHGVEHYRFVWDRADDQPIIVRLDIDAGGALVVGKVLSGGRGFGPGAVAEERTTRPSSRQVANIRRGLAALRYWRQPTGDTEPIDIAPIHGARWILEATVNGRYHLVDRWSGRNHQLQELCLAMVKLAKIKVPGRVY